MRGQCHGAPLSSDVWPVMKRRMRNTAFEFARAVENEIEALSPQDFHRRQGRAKVLLEEWYPISRLAIFLKQPGLEVTAEAFGDDGVADGRIEERGFRQRSFDIQVSYVDNYEGALRRELMLQQGFTPGAGPIARNRVTGAIEATIAAVDHDHNLKQAARGIAERFEKKAAKAYPADTVLLIAFDDMTLSGFSMWRSLLAGVGSLVKLEDSKFKAVYFINCATNELIRVA